MQSKAKCGPPGKIPVARCAGAHQVAWGLVDPLLLSVVPLQPPVAPLSLPSLELLAMEIPPTFYCLSCPFRIFLTSTKNLTRSPRDAI